MFAAMHESLRRLSIRPRRGCASRRSPGQTPASLRTLALSVLVATQAVGQTGPRSDFEVIFENDAVTSLKHGREGTAEYVQSGRRLGELFARWRTEGHDWRTSTNEGTPITLQSRFALQPSALIWTVELANLSAQEVELGDLALPLPISRGGRQRDGSGATNETGPVILKHSFISGHGSFLYWMRSDLVGPHLMLVPIGDTKLEYWEGSREGGYRVFIHSAAAILRG